MPKGKVKSVKAKKEVKVEAIVEDRSAYNCTKCAGEGLVGNLEVAGRHQLCDVCSGTGKI